jgi:hypothetical protein
MKFFVKIFLIEVMGDTGPYQPKYEQGDEGEKGIWRGAVLFTSLSAASFSKGVTVMAAY